ncbi:MAG: HAMP domain-containing histidine kinase [Bacteriovoracaceae bacterium]|nr:HAMP domain-containing histidine kinase [Bacteriovoracaceae bacterium]
MNLNQSVSLRLNEVLRKRTNALFIPHLLIVFVSVYIFRGMYDLHPEALMALGVILASLLIRKIMVQACSKERFTNCYTFLVMITGLGWGSLFWLVHQFYGVFNFETLYASGVILTLIGASATAFSASLKVAMTYLVSVSLVPGYMLFAATTETTYVLGFLLILNIIYQFYHAYVSHQYLKDSIHNELKALYQKNSLQEFIDSIPGIVTMVNTSGTHIMVNNYSNGFFKSKLLNKKVGEAFPDSTTSRVLKCFLESGKPEEIMEIDSDELGPDNWYMVNLKRISVPECGIIAVILPINELVKAKNDLRIHKARAMYASKLASLGELSAGIAHEVNNPLTIIEGAASLIKVILTERPMDEKALEKSADKIIETSHRIAKIIKGLRMLSKDAEEEPFDNISFFSIVEPSLEICKNKLLTQNIKLTVFNQESDVDLFGNEIQLGQVMMNLVSNAIDAVSGTDSSRWIEIHYKPSFDWVDIDVIDSGTGIPSEIVTKIMDPFFTTKETHQGTGLGLSISKKIIESHNGSLMLLTDAKNTTFRIRLPRMTLWPKV